MVKLCKMSNWLQVDQNVFIFTTAKLQNMGFFGFSYIIVKNEQFDQKGQNDQNDHMVLVFCFKWFNQVKSKNITFKARNRLFWSSSLLLHAQITKPTKSHKWQQKSKKKLIMQKKSIKITFLVLKLIAFHVLVPRSSFANHFWS